MIRIQKNGVVVDVTTEAELRMVLKVFGNDKNFLPLKAGEAIDVAENLEQMLAKIPVKSKAFEALYCLSNQPDGIIDKELVNKLQLSDNFALGGVLGNISRRAREFSLTASDVYVMESKGNSKLYRLTADMIKIMEQIKNKSVEADLTERFSTERI